MENDLLDVAIALYIVNLSPVCSMTRKPIRRTNKCAQEPQAPAQQRLSDQP